MLAIIFTASAPTSLGGAAIGLVGALAIAVFIYRLGRKWWWAERITMRTTILSSPAPRSRYLCAGHGPEAQQGESAGRPTR